MLMHHACCTFVCMLPVVQAPLRTRLVLGISQAQSLQQQSCHTFACSSTTVSTITTITGSLCSTARAITVTEAIQLSCNNGLPEPANFTELYGACKSEQGEIETLTLETIVDEIQCE